MKLIRISVICLIVFLTALGAFAKGPPMIPEPLKPWVDWVLHDHEEEFLCIPQHNNSSQLRCSWPTELKIRANSKGGKFKQEWLINYETWITLPGSDRHWPQNVKVNNKPVVVIKKNNSPQIKLQKGSYSITGEFRWKKIPEHLKIPAAGALVSVLVNNKKVNFPDIDNQGRLWLQSQREQEKKIENRLNIQVYRLIDDMIPPRVILRMNLDVAGSARETILGPPFSPDTFIPVSLRSSLPAKVEQDGRIRLQIRPGQWSLTLTVRHVGPITSFPFHKPEDGFWPDEEIWVFNARTNLRIVEIEGVPSIDPQQTSLPENWRNYPAYRMLPDNIMSFKRVKRGDPHPAPDQLTLQRNLWLRFDGSGYTIQDRIKGKKSSDWRLEMNPSINLGRVSIDGTDQFITGMEGSDRAGIELRKGNIDLTADSEYLGKISKIPATAWDHDFQEVNTSLFLPPGYRIINAGGVDNIPNTWITRWTLLDLFVVLIFTVAVAKLYSNLLAVTAFITLGLLYHEPGAPQWIWPAILVGIALLRYLPEGKFKKAVKLYQIFVTVVLIAIAVPFAIKELRVGIYPQMEKPWQSMGISYEEAKRAPSVSMVGKEPSFEEVESMAVQDARVPGKLYLREKAANSIGGKLKSESHYYQSRSQVAQYDPGMINQTGPGLPVWNWNTVYMKSGPVQRGQHISLTIVGPKVNLIVSFVRVVLLILLALGIFGIRYQRDGGWQLPDFKTLIMVPLVIYFLFVPETGHSGEIPSPEMFKELQKRLLEKDDCFPHCADIPEMKINITPAVLEITMSTYSQVDVAVPLPGNPKHWLPKKVSIDGQKAGALYKTQHGLWILTPAGKHTIILRGALPKYNTIQLPLPLKPHHITVSQNGWTNEGIHPDGTIDNQIQFKRITEKQSHASQILDTGVLPQFALVQRTLLLGLDWKVETLIKRISPTGSAIVLDVPLVQGESLITEGVKVNNGSAQISLDAQTGQVRWESVLDKVDTITLKHKETDQWTEIWQIDVSPIFHMEYEGIPVILHQQGDRWAPKWHPWPGEEVKLNISRPVGTEGQTLTIDKSHLEVRPGRRATDSKLTLSIRSSQGEQHTIVLPEGSELQEITIGNKPQPIRQEGRKVTLPIVPGTQKIDLKWRVHQGMSMRFKTPEIDLGIQHANSNIDVSLPYNRWPLVLSGPQLGPAILFWSVVIVIFLAAFGLSKTGFTPLRFHHWFLLGIGMSQSNIVLSIIVVGWLIALHFREQVRPDINKRTFNVLQTGIVLLTFSALVALIFAISKGLLGHPDMNIVGNGSNSGILRWYKDYSSHKFPQAGIFSVPMINYRLAMLAWALWISFSLIEILKWGWGNFTKPSIWYSLPKKTKPGTKVNVYKEEDKSSPKGPG